jgi:hypothetical protein
MIKPSTRSKDNARLVKKADTLFSLKVRSVGRCERCGGTSGLQASHIVSRVVKSLRWNPLNAICLCAKCHIFGQDSWHHNPIESARWFNARWPGRYDELKELQQSSIGKKVDMQEILDSLQ